MKVFISWSGDMSREIAAALNEWLPVINQNIEPFLSSEDIEKGSRWLTHLSQELQNTHYGLLCLTAENVEAPWVCFEAGALAKIIDSSRVAPILFGLKPSDLKGPLAQFQATKFDYDDFLKLLKGINSSAGDEARDDASLEQVIKLAWPPLETKLKGILAKSDGKKSKKENTEKEVSEGSKIASILEEVLLLSRQQAQVLSDPRALLPPEYLSTVIESRAGYESRMAVSPSAWEDLADCHAELGRILQIVTSDRALFEEPNATALLQRLDHVLGYVLRRAGIRRKKPLRFQEHDRANYMPSRIRRPPADGLPTVGDAEGSKLEAPASTENRPKEG